MTSKSYLPMSSSSPLPSVKTCNRCSVTLHDLKFKVCASCRLKDTMAMAAASPERGKNDVKDKSADVLNEKCTKCPAKCDDARYKTCARCRKQSREGNRKRNENIRLQKAAAQASTMVDGKNKLEVSGQVAGAVTLKRKNEAEGEPRKKKRTKHLPKATVSEDSESEDDPMMFGTDFQTSSQLYKHLKKLMRKNTRPNFQASYSIVADPDCGNANRASLVVRDIRKIAHISFNHKRVVMVTQSSTSFHSVYPCTCHTVAKPDGKSTKTSNQAVRANLNTIDPQSGQPSSIPEPCRGELVISVLDDNRHPVGIPGQQIRIQIRH